MVNVSQTLSIGFICSLSFGNLFIQARLNCGICIFTVLDFLVKIVFYNSKSSITNSRLIVYIFFQFSFKSCISILTSLNFSSYLSTVCLITRNSVFDFLVNLFCDCSQFLGNGSSKVGVISKGISNFLKSIKYFWSRTNNLLDSCIYLFLSLETRIVDKLRKMRNIICLFLNSIKFSFEYIGKVILSQRIAFTFIYFLSIKIFITFFSSSSLGSNSIKQLLLVFYTLLFYIFDFVFKN